MAHCNAKKNQTNNQIIKGVEFNSEPSGPRDVQMAQEAVSHTSCAESTRVHNDTMLLRS